jgi:thiamine-monophosphate kinase
VIGYSHDKGPVKRSGAKLGDIICVTGPLGGSIDGKHLSFEPRLKEAKELMDKLAINAMIDISDGLAKDLKAICDDSSLGALLDMSQIPISENILGSDIKLEKALTDGEDFELCLTLSKKEYDKYLGSKLETKLFPIGEIIESEGIYYQEDGKSKRLELMAYTHIF